MLYIHIYSYTEQSDAVGTGNAVVGPLCDIQCQVNILYAGVTNSDG